MCSTSAWQPSELVSPATIRRILPICGRHSSYYGNVADIASSPGTFFPNALTKLSSDGHVPTVYNYNVGIQRELPWNLFTEVSYVGTQSRHLWLAQPFNLAPLGSAWLPSTQDPNVTPKFDGNTNLPVNFYRPYAGYTNATDYTWGTNNNYNALQASLNRRVGAGLQIGVSYTWSKALGVSVGHINDTRTAGYGPLPQDRTQSLVVNYIYSIPAIRKGSFMDHAATRVVLNNWRLSGLTSVSSGAPVNVTYSVSGIAGTTLNRMITGSEDVAPRVVFTCNPNKSAGDRTLDAFINTSCFAPAQKGSVGLDSGYDRLRGPGLQNWDMSLFKNIPIKEQAHVELRLEAYNAFNHAEFGTFNTAVTFNAAGQVGEPANATRRNGRTTRLRDAQHRSRQQPAYPAGRGEDLLLIRVAEQELQKRVRRRRHWTTDVPRVPRCRRRESFPSHRQR